MATRASLKPTLKIGKVAFPIAIYGATQENKISFNLIHDCGTRLKQESMVCPQCDVEVKDRSLKGYTAEDGKVYPVTQDEINACRSLTDNTVKIEKLVPEESVDPIYFESAYYVGPDSKNEALFSAFRDSLRNRNVMALGALSSKGRVSKVGFRAYEDGIMMHYMYRRNEIRKCEVGTVSANVDATLRSALEANMDMVQEKGKVRACDTYMSNLKALIQSKIDGSEYVNQTCDDDEYMVADLNARS